MEKVAKIKIHKFKDQIITASENLSVSFNGQQADEIYEAENLSTEELTKIKKTKKIPLKLTKIVNNTKIDLPQ